MRIADRFRWICEDWLGPLLLAALLFVLGCLGAGCASAKANSQKTLAGIQYAKDAAMKTWAAYVAREQKRADALPEGVAITPQAWVRILPEPGRDGFFIACFQRI